MVPGEGLEPSTHRFWAGALCHLEYPGGWWLEEDSNLYPFRATGLQPAGKFRLPYSRAMVRGEGVEPSTSGPSDQPLCHWSTRA